MNKYKSKYITRAFGGNHPVRDALPCESLSVFVNNKDWKLGERGDPRKCAIARACKRSFALPKNQDIGLAILRSIAYVPLPDRSSETGKTILRFRISGSIVKKWDKGAEVMEGLIRLCAPIKGQTLEAARQRSREWRETGGKLSSGIIPKPRYVEVGLVSKNRLRVRGGLYHHHHVVIKRNEND